MNLSSLPECSKCGAKLLQIFILFLIFFSFIYFFVHFGAGNPATQITTNFIVNLTSPTNWIRFNETALNDSSTAKNLTFAGNQNITEWIRLPKQSRVIDAKLNLSGYRADVSIADSEVFVYIWENTTMPEAIQNHIGNWSDVSVVWGCRATNWNGSDCSNWLYYIPQYPGYSTLLWLTTNDVVAVSTISNNNYVMIELGNYSTNPYLDVEGDGDTEWNYTGEFNVSSQTTANFSDSLNHYLSLCAADSYGNCNIPLKLHSDTAGKIQVSAINVTYDYNISSLYNVVKHSDRYYEIMSNGNLASNDLSLSGYYVKTDRNNCLINGTSYPIQTDANGNKYCGISFAIPKGSKWLNHTIIAGSPFWLNNQTSIPSYYGIKSYFNITWNDSLGYSIDTVLFESNFSGTPTNYTMVLIDPYINATEKKGVYNFNLTLPPGTFYWKSYANASDGVWNVSDTWYFTQSNQIASCVNINHPNEYYLAQNIIDSSASVCMNITSQNITLDCQGHRIDGTDNGFGIYLSSISFTNANITIKNCNISDWVIGIYNDGSNGNISILNNTFISNYRGISEYEAQVDNIIKNNTFYQNNIHIESIYLCGAKIYDNIFKEANQYAIEFAYTMNCTGSELEENLIYNNIFNNTNNVYFDFEPASSYNWNITKQIGTNIWNVSLGYIGGNAWFKPDGTGFSETSNCPDYNFDGFCEYAYQLATNNYDYLPIAKTVGQFRNQPPKWSSNISSTPTYYDPSTYSWFNVTWSDDFDANGFNTSLIEANFSGSLQNYTALRDGNTSYYKIILGAGTYQWKFYANDSNGLWNSTDTWYFTINKAPTEITLLLNGTDGDKTYDAETYSNFTVILNVSGKTVKLDSNYTGWVLQSGITPLYNISYLLRTGTWNLTGYFEGDQNYSSSFKTHYFTVLKMKRNVTQATTIFDVLSRTTLVTRISEAFAKITVLIGRIGYIFKPITQTTKISSIATRLAYSLFETPIQYLSASPILTEFERIFKTNIQIIDISETVARLKLTISKQIIQITNVQSVLKKIGIAIRISTQTVKPVPTSKEIRIPYISPIVISIATTATRSTVITFKNILLYLFVQPFSLSGYAQITKTEGPYVPIKCSEWGDITIHKCKVNCPDCYSEINFVVPWIKTVTLNNIGNYIAYDFPINATIPKSTNSVNDIKLYDPNGISRDFTANIEEGYINWTTTILPGETQTWTIRFNTTAPEVSEYNETVGIAFTKWQNVSSAADIDYEKVWGYTYLEDPSIYIKFYDNTTGTMEEFTGRTTWGPPVINDLNGNGFADYAQWIIPKISANTDKKLVIKSTIAKVSCEVENKTILNAPVLAWENVEWRWDIKCMNSVDITLSYSQDFRIPLESSRIYLDGKPTEPGFLTVPPYGPYVTLSGSIGPHENRTHVLEFLTPGVTVDIPPASFPSRFWVGEKANLILDITAKNWASETINETQTKINIVYGENIKLLREGFLVDSIDEVRGYYTLKIYNMTPYESRSYTLTYMTPVADAKVERYIRRIINSSQYLVYPFKVWSLTSFPVSPLWIRIKSEPPLKCSDIYQIWEVSESEYLNPTKPIKILNYECENTNATFVELSPLTLGQTRYYDVFVLEVEKPTIPEFTKVLYDFFEALTNSIKAFIEWLVNLFGGKK